MLSTNQDSQFFTIFSTVIGILVAVAVVLFGLARAVAGGTQRAEVYEDPMYVAEVEHRVEPFVHEAVAGQDNSALAIVATVPSASAASGPPVPKNGTELYQSVCSACHAAGVGGAPKAGDHAAWAPRLAEGKATLYEHALHGYQGKAGVMPAKGGRPDLPDALIEQGVDHLMALAK
jgi:cytochrome c5